MNAPSALPSWAGGRKRMLGWCRRAGKRASSTMSSASPRSQLRGREMLPGRSQGCGVSAPSLRTAQELQLCERRGEIKARTCPIFTFGKDDGLSRTTHSLLLAFPPSCKVRFNLAEDTAGCTNEFDSI